ncbi:MAG: phosphotransferase [Bdellovibrionaceae bacterium]|nr:phosphotransferase [Pseudobdellovibrionaceae bacterium]
MKYSKEPTNMFICEKHGLDEFAQVRDLKIPEVLLANNYCIVMDAMNLSYETLGLDRLVKSLRLLHNVQDKEFGFYEDNFIGQSTQSNTKRTKNWGEFFWVSRLLYKFDQLNEKESLTSEFKSEFLKLETVIYRVLGEVKAEPRLVHGDLWSGNLLPLKGGAISFVDPAVYYGHFEVDLAMTQLFGGVGDVYSFYVAHYSLDAGWELRMKIYNLYHLLNHAVIFSGSYVQQSLYQIKQISTLA